MTRPYAPPGQLPPDFTRIQAYWTGLLRGSAGIPFGDDLDLTTARDLAGRLMVIGVFEGPRRFRFDVVGDAVTDAFGQDIAGLFTDEIGQGAPLAFLTSQCGATVEGGAPTWFDSGTPEGGRRLLLPMWGDGRISMLLGLVDQGQA